MRTWHFYRLSDGTLTGSYFSAKEERNLEANIPEGCGAVEGVTRSHAQCVIDGEVVDYQPPAPSEFHEWDAGTKRYGLTAEASAAALAYDKSAALIDSLERASLRPLRELVADPSNEAAKAKLADIESQIAAARPALVGGKEQATARTARRKP